MTVETGTTRATPSELEAKLTIGRIERVIVLFPPGCLGHVKVALVHNEHQFLPEDPDGYITGDDYPFDMPMNYAITELPARIQVHGWSDAVTYDHAITVGIYLNEGSELSLADAILDLFATGGKA